MALQTQNIRIPFTNVAGLQQRFQPAFFNGRVQSATVMMQGFDISFGNGEHPVLQERMQLSVNSVNAGTVNVLATFLLRDNSRDRQGNIDDPTFGSIDAVVIADVV